MAMGPANALSQKDMVYTSEDNHEVTLLPQNDIIWQINVVLTKKIAVSTASDPRVKNAYTSMENEDSLLPHTSTKDWDFTWGSLYSKGWLYIPPRT